MRMMMITPRMGVRYPPMNKPTILFFMTNCSLYFLFYLVTGPVSAERRIGTPAIDRMPRTDYSASQVSDTKHSVSELKQA